MIVIISRFILNYIILHYPGMQGHIWTETVRTPEQLHFMLFPRVLALAERAWHKADWEKYKDKTKQLLDWTRFANNLGQKELLRLDRMGIKYRVPPPGAKYVKISVAIF
jgi:hexosaminidase